MDKIESKLGKELDAQYAKVVNAERLLRTEKIKFDSLRRDYEMIRLDKMNSFDVCKIKFYFHARDAVKIKKVHFPNVDGSAILRDELLQPTKKLKIDSPNTSPKPQAAQETKKPRSFWTQHFNFQDGNDDQDDAKGGINIEELIDEEIQNRTQKSTSVWSKTTST